MIEVENLTKYYGRMAAIKDVSFRVESGEIVGFLAQTAQARLRPCEFLRASPPHQPVTSAFWEWT